MQPVCLQTVSVLKEQKEEQYDSKLFLNFWTLFLQITLYEKKT